MNNSTPINASFKKHEVEDYERKRYRGIDQRIVHGRETRIIRKILLRIRPNGQKEETDLQRALDIPCGYGRFSSLLQVNGFSLVSSDLSFHMVKRAVDRYDNPERIPGVVADAKLGLPFKPDAFFLLFSMRFFHHLHEKKDREAILKEFTRVTSDWMVLSYYQINRFHLFQRKVRKRLLKKKTKIKMISRTEFQEEINGAGFEVVKVFPLFRGIHAHHIALLRKQGSQIRNWGLSPFSRTGAGIRP